MPRFRRKIHEASEERIDEDADRHGLYPADFVAEPAEEHAAAGRAEEERGRDVAHPEPDKRIGNHEPLAGLHLLQRRPGDQGKDAHLKPVEHPAESGCQQDGKEALFRRGRGVGLEAGWAGRRGHGGGRVCRAKVNSRKRGPGGGRATNSQRVASRKPAQTR